MVGSQYEAGAMCAGNTGFSISLSGGGVRVKMHGQALATIPESFVLGKVRPVRDLVSRSLVEGLKGELPSDQITLEQSRDG